jgi:hypothetical protein
MPRREPDTKTQLLVDRRTILLASTALATPLAVPKIAERLSAPQQTDEACEYRETEHIRQFYAKCRF